MEEIKNVLSKVLSDISLGRPDVQAKIQHIWQNAFDKKAVVHSMIVGLEKGCLMVNVDSPAWLFQLSLKKKKILEKLKEEVPQLSQIRFKIGKVK